MPRLYFNLFEGVRIVPDEEGKEVPDIATARDIAVNAIRSIVADDANQGVVDLRGRIEICNEEKEVLAVLRFSEAVELLLETSPASGKR